MKSSVCKSILGILIILSTLILFIKITEAAIFNVENETELMNALSTASSNYQDDEILILSGIYNGSFLYFSTTESYSLKIIGGYVNSFSNMTDDPSKTVLDAGASGHALTIASRNVEADILIENITLQNGYVTTNNGGGLFIETTGSVEVKRIIAQNSYCSGFANARGGGVYINTIGIEDYASIIFSGNLVKNNFCTYVGGVYLNGQDITANDNTIVDNQSTKYCGGILVSCNSASIASNSATISGNVIMGNKCIGSYSGGLMVSFLDNVIVTNNLIANNTDTGFGFFNIGGGGIFVYNFGENEISSIINNTIVNNTSGGKGGGIYVDHYRATDEINLYNNIFWNNSGSEGNDIYVQNDGDADFIPSTSNVYYNDFDQGQEGTHFVIPITIDPSNINGKNPFFVASADNNFRLTENSPCIDSGINTAPGIPINDKDTKPRIIDGDSNELPIVDMGAYEYGDICEGDFQPDGDVDGSDLAIFAADFGRTDCDTGELCEGDCDSDNNVVGVDLAVFAADFGRTDCP